MSEPSPSILTPTPEEVQAAETIIDAAHAQETPVEAPPPEPTWLLHYSGTEPLTIGDVTWEPDSLQRLPESVARRLVGSNDLRVVQDEDIFNQMRERTHHG